MSKEDYFLGVVDYCEKLNIRDKPDISGEILTKLPKDSELIVFDQFKDNTWYKITTASGMEGFCMKRYIRVV